MAEIGPDRRIILAIESAIAGGSVSILRDGQEVAHWIGTSETARAEDLLASISGLLSANRIGRDEIGLIAVSAGPGSFTGIRIGIATALGLKAGLNIATSSTSALRAMVHGRSFDGPIMAAVPVGRCAICVQTFEASMSETDKPRVLREEEFIELARSNDGTIVMHESIFNGSIAGGKHINFGKNIAYAIGQACAADPDLETAPIFISKSF